MLLTRQVLDQFREEANKLNEKHLQEKWQQEREDQKVGNRWSKEKKIEMCGKKIGEYQAEDGSMKPFIYHCGQYDGCEDCASRKGDNDRFGIERAANKFLAENPSARLRYTEVAEDDEAAYQKKIKRHGGQHRRIAIGNGKVGIFYACDDDLGGQEIKPEISYDEGTNQPYEHFNLTEFANNEDDGTDYFTEAAKANRTNNTRYGGKLFSVKTEGTDKIRYTVITYDTEKDESKKHRIDAMVRAYLSKGEVKPQEKIGVPLEIVNNNDELQQVLDAKRTIYIEAYTKFGLEFEVKTIWRTRDENVFEEWNREARLNIEAYERICPNNSMVTALEKEVPYAYLDIGQESLVSDDLISAEYEQATMAGVE